MLTGRPAMEKQHKFSIWYVLIAIWTVLIIQHSIAQTFRVQQISYRKFLADRSSQNSSWEWARRACVIFSPRPRWAWPSSRRRLNASWQALRRKTGLSMNAFPHGQGRGFLRRRMKRNARDNSPISASHATTITASKRPRRQGTTTPPPGPARRATA
jgi:hypothetical protein